MASRKRYPFLIPIGDWSDDGHGKVSWKHASATKPIKDVREAYFKSRKDPRFEDITPEDICAEYGDFTIPDHLRNVIMELSGIDLTEGENDEEFVEVHQLAKYLVWFINEGDPSLKVRLEQPPEMLPFYGFDKKKRHIGGLGYGLFE